MKKALILSALTVLISACASNPKDIDATYVSALKYKDYDCDQLAMEMDYISHRTTKLYNSLQSERTKDNWQMGGGWVLFWPSLFFLEGGDGPEAAEYAQLKGEYEALRKNVVQRKCGFEYESPEEILKKQDTESTKTD